MIQNSKPPKQVIDLVGHGLPDDFYEAIATTRQGDEIIYWRGDYAGGRMRVVAMEAQEAGLVNLIQRRSSKQEFLYLAQRTKKRLE